MRYALHIHYIFIEPVSNIFICVVFIKTTVCVYITTMNQNRNNYIISKLSNVLFFMSVF